MESGNSADHEKQQKKRRVEAAEETYNYFFMSPCSLCQQLIKGVFKCFGRQDHDDDDNNSITTQQTISNISASATETEMKSTHEEEIFAVESRAIRANKTPPRPPIGSGRGGQTN